MRQIREVYFKYKSHDLWCIKEEGFDPFLQGVRESQFALGNGYIGSRAVLEELPPGASAGTYLAGVYDGFGSQVSEIVNLPNPFIFRASVEGEKIGVGTMDILEHRRILDMRKGLLIRRTLFRDSKGRRYDYQSLRFIAMHSKNIGIMQIVLATLDADVEVELYSSIDTSVFNKGGITEGRKRHFRIKEFEQEEFLNYLVVETLAGRHFIIYRSGVYYRVGRKKMYATDNVLRLTLRKNNPIIFTKVVYISFVSNRVEELNRERGSSKKRFLRVFRTPFEKFLFQHIEEWQNLWVIADITIKGADDVQNNLRFNIYHMLICGYANEGFSSIGARTLSGEGYHGHIFWDAEIFNLPFYAFVMPHVAKSMLLYRYCRLNQAREIAREKGFKGAMFPWESADTGYEETPMWAKNLDGTIIKIKTARLEQHVSADIAFACFNYVRITGDNGFLWNEGCEIIFETARFWSSRVSRGRGGIYEIKGVIGPDEFHEDVNNNAYTNMMARWNLLVASRMFYRLRRENIRQFKVLTRKLNLTQTEVNTWRVIAQNLKLRRRSDGVIEQFDGFFKKRYIELMHFDENGLPILPSEIKVKDFHKTQLVKQADVLMLLFLLPELFSNRTKVNNFWYYVKRTVHKSSLSPAIHACLAAEIGEMSRAYQFFNIALRADICNLHGNTAEGIHAASLGGTWMAVINGFAGIKIKRDMLSVNPFLPQAWEKVRCTFFWRYSLFQFEITHTWVRVKFKSRYRRKLKIEIFGKSHTIPPDKEIVVKRDKKYRRLENYYL